MPRKSPYQTDQERACGVDGTIAAILFDISASDPREDRAVGQQGIIKRRYRCPARYATSDRQQMAPALLYPALIRTRRAAAGRATRPLFPPM